MGFFGVIGLILGGAIIGFLGRVVAPGDRDRIPLWLTILCGIGGILLGSFLYFAIYGGSHGHSDMFDTSRGFDWWRHAWEIVTAAVLVMVAATATGRSRR